MSAASSVAVRVGMRVVGEISATPGHRHVFCYEPGVPAEDFVALTMPVRREAYLWQDLHPVFAAWLPRGAFAGELERLLAREGRVGALALLTLGGAAAGRARVVGEVSAETPTPFGAAVLGASDSRAALKTAIEAQLRPALGEQRLSAAVLHDGSLHWRAADGFFRAAPSDCPEWAYNASVCQRIAARAGVDVAPLALAEDGLTVGTMTAAGTDDALAGVEDLGSLQGLSSAERYASSAERMVTAAAAFAPPVSRVALRRELFRRLALSALLRDGAAHLQRFALQYDSANSVGLTPFAGTVTTSIYAWYGAPRLALAIGGGRAYHRPRGTWRRFGAHCALSDRESRAIIEWLTAALYTELPLLEEEARADDTRARALAALKAEWTEAAETLKAGW